MCFCAIAVNSLLFINLKDTSEVKFGIEENCLIFRRVSSC
ncbi:hypothetical protein X975_23555, partial [Stegodyphus mimosarum]